MLKQAFAGKRAGIAYVISLLLLAVFSSIALAFVSMSDLSAQKARNCREAQTARMAAESGLAYHMYVLSQCRPTDTGREMIAQLASKLSAKLDGTANMGHRTVAYADGATEIYLPAIPTCDGRGGFSARLSLDESDESLVWLTVDGRCGRVRRIAKLAFQLEKEDKAVFDYGLATRGKVRISGQGNILSANDSLCEASVLSTFYDPSENTFDLSGQVIIEGNIFTSQADAGISIGSKVRVAEPHVGVGDVDFPEPNPAIYEPFATNLMSDHSPGKGTYTNIRIPANTNPTFASNTVLRGVIYVEQPNDLKFAGKVTIQGVIVTEDARGSANGGSLDFSGQVTSLAIDTLPDSPEFAELKQLPGFFLMAPGFDASFSGQFGTINGAMVADSFRFSGQAGGIVEGVVIAYSDESFEYSGQAGITIDRSGSSDLPAGFKIPGKLTPLPDTYREF